jgi:hypothetical protein
MDQDIAVIHEAIWRYLSAFMRLDKSRVLSALDAIEAEEEFESYRPLAALCVTNNELIRWRAWTVLNAKLPQLKVKWIWYTWHESAKDKLTMLSLVVNSKNTPVNVLGVISANADGHVRETAVRALQQRYEGLELAFLIVRSNDWVEKIRHLAGRAIQDRIPRADYVKAFVQELPLLYRLWETKRNCHKELRHSVESVLTSPSAIPHLLRWIDSAQAGLPVGSTTGRTSEDSLFGRQVTRYALDLLFRSPVALDAAIRKGLKSADAVVRTRAAKAALERLPEEAIPNLVAELLQEKLPAIRKDTLRWIAERDWPERDAMLRAGLFDRNGGIRNLARYYLRDNTALNIPDMYRNEVRSAGSNSEKALLGLAELKCTVPLSELQQHLESERKCIRAAAYQALFAGDLPERFQLGLKGLQDPSAEIVRIASSYLGDNATMLDGEELWSMLSMPAMSEGSRRAIMKLVCKLNKWESLYYLLRATELVRSDASTQELSAQPPETTRRSRIDYWSLRASGPAYVDEALWNWIQSFNQRYDRPTGDQMNRCKEALEKYSPHVHPRLVQELEQILR